MPYHLGGFWGFDRVYLWGGVHRVEFTKNELELIQNNLSWNECPDINNQLLVLNNKLTRMIAEYCEHKSTNYDDGLNYCDDCGVFVK
jgi:hypothetical protein